MKTTLLVLLVAACAARGRPADVARPSSAPWCVPVVIAATAKAPQATGLACVPTEALCLLVQKAALRWGRFGGLGPIGRCAGPQS